MEIDLFALVAEALKMGSGVFIEDDTKRVKRELEQIKDYRKELEGQGAQDKKSKSGDEIRDLKKALEIVREARDKTLCVSCKDELGEMEKDMLKHIFHLGRVDVGRDVLHEKFPGKKYDELSEEEKADIKAERDASLE